MMLSSWMTKLGSLIIAAAIFYPQISFSQQKNIILIGNPRGLTTAFERYMIKRGDYEIYHEPFSMQAWLDRMQVMSYSRLLCGDSLLLTIHESPRKKPYFIKDMAFFLQDNPDLMQLVKSDAVQVVFLIREPEQAVLSHYKLTHDSPANSIFGGTREEMQYTAMEDLYFKIMQVKNAAPIIIDAADLTADPKAVLSKMCAQIGISFNEEDLQWESGENNHWSMTAEPWHTQVTKSKGFIPGIKSHSLSEVAAKDRPDIGLLIRSNEVIYNRLAEYKINPAKR